MNTTLGPQTIAALARVLYDARKSHTQLRHFSKRHAGMTIEDGYAVQRAWVALEMADGRVIRGRKNTRIEFRRDGAEGFLDVELPRAEYAALRERLQLQRGSRVFLRPRRVTRFRLAA